MLNLVPRTHPSVSLLYGKRALQRVVAGSTETHIEIPISVTDDIQKAADTETCYVGNKFHALPWKKYVDIKLDASNLIESNVKSALTHLAIYKPLEAMYLRVRLRNVISRHSILLGRHIISSTVCRYIGEKTVVEKNVSLKMAGAVAKLPMAK